MPSMTKGAVGKTAKEKKVPKVAQDADAKPEVKIIPEAKPGTKVLHPVLTVNGIEIPPESMVRTAEEMKELLGWQEEPEDGAFGRVYHHIDQRGKKIRLTRNMTNRPFDHKTAERIMQDVLTRNYAGYLTVPDGTINGEAMIIGRLGSALSIQHRGCGLIWAEQRWQGWKDGVQSEDIAAHWHGAEFWPDSPPIMESLLVCGVSEDPRVLRTIDNVRPRTLSDVLYTSPTFADLGSKDRQRLSKIMAGAVNLLWLRVALDDAGYAGRKTHSQAVDFVERHPSLIKAVKHIGGEGEKRIGAWIGPGTAAGLLYLMGTSTSEPGPYFESDRPDESMLDLSMWDKAEEFWTLLADKNPTLRAVALATFPMEGDTPKSGHSGFVFGEGEGSGSGETRFATLIKAWNVFSLDTTVTPESIQLLYDVKRADDDSVAYTKLDENPTTGGIDRGGIVEQEQPDGEGTAEPEPEPESFEDGLMRLKSENPGLILLFASKSGGWNAWGEDAEAVAKALKERDVKAKFDKAYDTMRLTFKDDRLQDYASIMRVAGLRLATVTVGDAGLTVTELKAPAKRAPKPIQPTVKPATDDTAGPEAGPATRNGQAGGKKPVAKDKKKGPTLRGGTAGS